MVDLQVSAKVFVFGPVLPMSLLCRSLRRSVFFLLCLLSGVCAAPHAAAQVPQFSVPSVIPTGNWPANIGAGDVDNTGKPSLLSCDPYSAGATLACHLYQLVGGVWTATQSYPLAGGTTAAKAIVVNDPVLGLYGVAILSVQIATPRTSYFTIQYYADGIGTPTTAVANTPGGAAPVLADFAYRPSPALLHEPGMFIATDSANGYFYLLDVSSSGLTSTTITYMPCSVTGPNPSLCGAILPNLYPTTGPHGGRPAFALVSTNNTSVGTVVVNPDGTWSPIAPPGYTGSGNVYSALLADMDGDGVADLVTEGDNGRIDIYHGLTDGTFVPTSEGGSGGLDGVSGNGGRLVAIADVNGDGIPDILTATPIGLSVLLGQGGGKYTLKGIYDIGPGRASYALADINGDGHPDLVVDSPEGVAIVLGDANGDGGFQTSNAYSALAPGLGAVVGKFRNAANNPAGNVDVVVGTGATQAQLLQGNGDGTFNPFPSVVDTGPGPGYPPSHINVPAQVWSNISSGDFDGDGNLDILFTLTGAPPPQPIGTYPIVYLQYGNGDGTFDPIGNDLGLVWSGASIYNESTIGDFDGDGVSDLGTSGEFFDTIWLGCRGQHLFCLGFGTFDINNTSFSQVAAGFFKVNRTSQQDVVFQEGANFIPYGNKVDGTGKNFAAMPVLTGPGAPLYPATVLLTDLDGDGNGDLVAVYYNTASNPVGAGPVSTAQLYIWYGKGDGTFLAPQILSLSRNYYLGAVADMNADGHPDLVLSDGSLVGILYNQGGRSFGGEKHFLAGQGINSLSVADVNGDGVPDLIVANGGATISSALVLGGRTSASISLTPNPVDINTGGITVLRNYATAQQVFGRLVAFPEPSTYQATFTLTATITPSPGVALPTGQVQFFIDGNLLGAPVTLVRVPAKGYSTATYPVPAQYGLQGGFAHPIGAQYFGDAFNLQAALLGDPGTHFITSGATTTELFLCIGPTPGCPAGYVMPPPMSALPMTYGQYWNGTVLVTAADGGPLPGNTLIFDSYNGGAPTLICTLQTSTGGSCDPSVGTTVGTSAGTNVITAAYDPGTIDAAHTESTSLPVTITVSPDTVQAKLAGAPNPSPAGLPVTFTATLTGNFAPPTGTVNFVELFPPTALVQLLGTVTLVPGLGTSSTATFITSKLPVGVDTIGVSYAGTTVDFDAAKMAVFLETITPGIGGSFKLTATPTPVSVGVGYSTLLTVTVTPAAGFSQDVHLSCTNLPSEATCFFDTSTLAGGSGTTNLVVGTTAPHSCGTTQPYFLGFNGGANGSGPGLAPIALPALAGLLAMFLPGRRRWLRTLIAVIVAVAATQTTGCGTCTDLGTRPATYTFQVTGTASGTSEVQAQSVTITVTI